MPRRPPTLLAMTRSLTGAAAAALLALTLSSCSSSADDEPPTTNAGDASSEETGAPEADPWPARIKKWERENAIATSNWYDLVKSTEVDDFMGLLDVTTTIVNDGDAAAAAEPICGSYSTISFEYKRITVVRVLARDGGLITKCGPGA